MTTNTYTPAHFGCDDAGFIQQFLQQHYFGLLLSDNLQFSALPFWFDWDTPAALSGTVYCHLARKNPQLLTLQQAVAQGSSVKLVIQGPHAYVAAECYQQQPQVATWNYSLVEISGSVQLLESAATLALVRKQQATANSRLPATVQAALVSRRSGRSAMLAYEKQLAGAIVGVAIKINSVNAKMKLSQNKNPEQRQDVVQFLQQTEQQAPLWQLMLAQSAG